MASKSGSAKNPPSIKLRLPVNLEMLKKKTKGAKAAEGHKAEGKATTSAGTHLPRPPGTSPAGSSSRPRYEVNKVGKNESVDWDVLSRQ